MAEALGIASSVTALIQNTIVVINYLKDVKNAPKECDELLTELRYLEVGLSSIGQQIRSSTKGDPWLETLQQLQDHFKELMELLDELKARLKDGSSRLKRLMRRLDWTITKKSVEEDLGKIERLKSLIMVAGQHDHLLVYSKLSLAIQKMLGDIEVKVWESLTTKDKNRLFQLPGGKIVNAVMWLSALDYNTVRHNKLKHWQCASHMEEWFFESPEFLSWVDVAVAPFTLWCVGGPGVGKTILASNTVERLCAKFNKEDTLVLCIFCDYNSAVDQTVTNLMRSLLKQLVYWQARLSLTASIEFLYDWYCYDETQPSLKDCISLLFEELKSYDCVYIVLDALDELDDDGRRKGLIDALRALGSQIRLLVTSRNLDTMRSLFEADTKLEIRASDTDVEKCIMAGLMKGNLLTFLSENKNLYEKILKAVVEKADGV
ncbi:uncharacterized protein EV420DRAFT_1279815 [Desarmillaria tabescens]|uniref:Inhibitor of growth protein N-terminal histone-binding domain-containing protein n=1 Tax=Armillaria tabescens TaxID=1929756 RepID=A0AA39JA80_ARMTA|nr:uncharacterized protein EV420DRAFT_1279815 [Desarmillaria tabescens]KAK0439045.1 hypothetical protein EV420DRAFT_1279815 [Desarmillaria tabescens]